MLTQIVLREDIAREIEQIINKELLDFFKRIKHIVIIHGSLVKSAYLKQTKSIQLNYNDIDFAIICSEEELKKIKLNNIVLEKRYKNKPLYIITIGNYSYELAVLYEPDLKDPLKIMERSAYKRDFKENSLMMKFKNGFLERTIYDFTGGIFNLNQGIIETIAPITEAFGQKDIEPSKKNYHLIRVFRLFNCLAQHIIQPKISVELHTELLTLRKKDFLFYKDAGLLRKELYKGFLSGKGLLILSLYEKYETKIETRIENYATLIFPHYNKVKGNLKSIIKFFDENHNNFSLLLIEFYSLILWPICSYIFSQFGSEVDHWCELIDQMFCKSKIYFSADEIDYLIAIWSKWIEACRVGNSNFMQILLNGLIVEKKQVSDTIKTSTSYADIVKKTPLIQSAFRAAKNMVNLVRSSKTHKDSKSFKKYKFFRYKKFMQNSRIVDNNNNTSPKQKNKNKKIEIQKKPEEANFFSENYYNVMAKTCEDYSSDNNQKMEEDDHEIFESKIIPSSSKLKSKNKPTSRSLENINDTDSIKRLVAILASYSNVARQKKIDQDRIGQEKFRQLKQAQLGKGIKRIIEKHACQASFDIIQYKIKQRENILKKLQQSERDLKNEYFLFKAILILVFQDVGRNTICGKLTALVALFLIIAVGVYGIQTFPRTTFQLTLCCFIDLFTFDAVYKHYSIYENKIITTQLAIYNKSEAEKTGLSGKINYKTLQRRSLDAHLKSWKKELETMCSERTKLKGRACYEKKDQIQKSGIYSFFRPYYLIDSFLIILMLQLIKFFIELPQDPEDDKLSMNMMLFLGLVHYWGIAIIDNILGNHLNQLETNADKEMEILLTPIEAFPSISNSF